VPREWEPGSLAGVAAAAQALEREVRAFVDTQGATVADLATRAEAAWHAGRVPEAAALGERALRREEPGDRRVRLLLLLAETELLEGHAHAAHERLRTEAAAEASPARRALLLCEASRAAFLAPDPRAAVVAAEEAVRLAGTCPDELRVQAELSLALARMLADERGAEQLLGRALDRTDSSPPTLLGSICRSAGALLWAERYDAATTLLEHVVERAREQRLLEVLPTALDTLAGLEARIGRWSSAEGRSREALRLARLRSSPFEQASALTTLARLEAARGREPETRARVEEALALCGSSSLLIGYAATAAALLELSIGHPEQAVDHLQQLASSPAATFEPGVFRWEADHVEALVRTGRLGEAQDALDRFAGRARSTRRIWTRAVIHRCRGLLAPREGFDLEFQEALRWHTRSPMPFERARTELCYAERLRRAGRISEARPFFVSALGTFEHLGAAPWAVRARRGLHRAGRSAAAQPVESTLTSHELQVAALVARGATNREAAASLFVTPKTIEYHLARIYRKLGVRSRTELSCALREGGGVSRAELAALRGREKAHTGFEPPCK